MFSMDSYSIFPFIGFLFLIFRVWLAEVKLRDVLKDERQYMSRIYTYYLAAMLIYDFKNMGFNLLVVAVLPYMLVSLFVWDVGFFKRLQTIEEYKDHLLWIKIERLTSHIPLVIGGLLPYFFGIKSFVLAGMDPNDIGVIYGLIFAIIMLYLPILTLDVRFTKKTKYKTALMIIAGGTFFSILWSIIILFVYR
jgi:hypothetical protein